MSSYLSKSKKAFKPRIPSARPPGAGVAASPQSSVRGSVDRQTQTPQPPHFQLTPAGEGSRTSTRGDRVSGAFVDSNAPAVESSTGLHPAESTSSAPLFDDEVSHAVPDIQLQQTSPQPDPQRSVAEFSGDVGQEASEEQPGAGPSLLNEASAARTSRSYGGAAALSIEPEEPVLPTPPLTQNVPNQQKTGDAATNEAVAHAVQRRQPDPTDNGADTTAPIDSRAVDSALVLLDTEQSTGPLHQDGAQGDVRSQQRRPRQSRARSNQRRRGESAINETSGEAGEASTAQAIEKAKRGKRKREATPEEYEANRIAPTVVTMTDLTKDTRLGKKSNRERRLQARDKETAQKKLEAAQEQARRQAEGFMEDPLNPTTTNPSTATTGAATAAAAAAAASLVQAPPPPPPPRLAPRVRVVNGQIVHDEESRIIDRHAAATAAESGGRGEDNDNDAVSEDELTRRINSGSYMRRERHAKWTAEETELFFDGIRMFGTDFMVISKMFPGRTRRQIKLKFNKEERAAPDRVHHALYAERRTASVAEFERLAGVTLPDVEAFEEDMDNDRERLEEEQARETAALRQMQQAREEAIRAEAEDAPRRRDAAGAENVNDDDVEHDDNDADEEMEEAEANPAEQDEVPESNNVDDEPVASDAPSEPATRARSSRRGRKVDSTAAAAAAASPVRESADQSAADRPSAGRAGRGRWRGRGSGRAGAAGTRGGARALRERAKPMIETM